MLAQLALPGRANAQTTHVVGTGGFAQIRQALAIALPGDTIEVQPGTYSHFEMNVGVTLRAVQAGAVLVVYDVNYYTGAANEGATAFAIPAGQEALVQGIVFHPSLITLPSGSTVKHRVVAGGRISFDACEFRAYDNIALAAYLADLRLLRCTIATEPSTFGVPACTVNQSTASMVDCTIRHQGALFTTGIATALYMDNSVLVGSRLSLSGVTTGLSAGRGLIMIGGRAWISDSSILAGTNRCAIEGASFVTLARTTVLNRINGCGTASPGQLLGIGTLGPVQLGSNYALQFTGAANSLVAVFAAPNAVSVSVPEVEQPVLLDLSTAFAAGLGSMGPSGSTTLSWAIPSLPTLVGLPIWFQGITGPGAPFAASAAAGGLAR
ncbi:MAG: hypothetical protein MUC36_18590 [Planctomycetes bacterium]|nr:hypothetical protein [Planctomycetota bacterium]